MTTSSRGEAINRSRCKKCADKNNSLRFFAERGDLLGYWVKSITKIKYSVNGVATILRNYMNFVSYVKKLVARIAGCRETIAAESME